LAELLPSLVEEVLRLDSPVQGMYRRANEDTTFAGVLISVGQRQMAIVRVGQPRRRNLPRE
jgi:cytochrome P450